MSVYKSKSWGDIIKEGKEKNLQTLVPPPKQLLCWQELLASTISELWTLAMSTRVLNKEAAKLSWISAFFVTATIPHSLAWRQAPLDMSVYTAYQLHFTDTREVNKNIVSSKIGIVLWSAKQITQKIVHTGRPFFQPYRAKVVSWAAVTSLFIWPMNSRTCQVTGWPWKKYNMGLGDHIQ